jgi:hypothetical protein
MAGGRNRREVPVTLDRRGGAPAGTGAANGGVVTSPAEARARVLSRLRSVVSLDSGLEISRRVARLRSAGVIAGNGAGDSGRRDASGCGAVRAGQGMRCTLWPMSSDVANMLRPGRHVGLVFHSFMRKIGLFPMKKSTDGSNLWLRLEISNRGNVGQK